MSDTDSDDGASLIDFYPDRDRFRTYRRLEPEPRSRESILAALSAMAEEEDRLGDSGHVSGSIYHGGHDHYRFLTECFGLFAHANVLQRDMYPSATKLESEIVAMTASMMHGDAVKEHHRDEEACGVITFGGTESLIDPLLVYRERGRVSPGIADSFLEDLREAVEYAARTDLGTPNSGALYGLGGTRAGNELLDTLFAAALDAMNEVAPSRRDG